MLVRTYRLAWAARDPHLGVQPRDDKRRRTPQPRRHRRRDTHATVGPHRFGRCSTRRDWPAVDLSAVSRYRPLVVRPIEDQLDVLQPLGVGRSAIRARSTSCADNTREE